MIQPGLERISLLLAQTQLTWKAVHVAGTNGKGSICAVVSSMLAAANIRCGRFTSPHLIDRWDCISINNQPVSEALFRSVEARVASYSRLQNIKASEFELLTATAFEIFNEEKVQVGVVEVGMGGRLDATNVLTQPYVTVISQIGLDHQAFLGETVEEIAREKAGILKPGVPCVVNNAANKPQVLDVIRSVAGEVQAGPLVMCDGLSADVMAGLPTKLQDTLLSKREPYEQVNLSCALEAVKHVLNATHRPFTPSTLLAAASDRNIWPGRLQHLVLEPPLVEARTEILLDGAHNQDGASVLAGYVEKHCRNTTSSSSPSSSSSSGPITWVLSASQGKNLQRFLPLVLRDGDCVVTVEFGPVDGMPWVKPMASESILELSRGAVRLEQGIDAGTDTLGALRRARDIARGGPIVVAGSLYLVSDVLRLHGGRAESARSG